MKYRVKWYGPQTGHAQWAEKTVHVATEEEGRALVAAPMKAGFNVAVLFRDDGKPRLTTIVERKRARK